MAFYQLERLSNKYLTYFGWRKKKTRSLYNGATKRLNGLERYPIMTYSEFKFYLYRSYL